MSLPRFFNRRLFDGVIYCLPQGREFLPTPRLPFFMPGLFIPANYSANGLPTCVMLPSSLPFKPLPDYGALISKDFL